MSVASADLLAAAQRIFSNGTCEADWRAVCSRGYYAIYHDLQAFADSLAQAAFPGHIPAGMRGGMHHQLYTSLQNPTVPKSDPRNRLSFKLGVMAKSLHSARIKADYEPALSVDQVEAQTNLTAAANVPALIANQQVGSPLPKFTPTNSSPPPGSGSGISPTPTSPGKGAPPGGFKIVK